ncbi:uncharacterized protein [Apostichopus japonicus]|uniref:uncharacterized protein n=1 Tax=Stichopus japonicus TaxID=307972 RepID=UPI003AB4D0CA
MPRTKKLSYRQRNKTRRESKQNITSNQTCQSQQYANKTLSEKAIEQHSVGQSNITDINLQSIHTYDTFTFFPPDDLWRDGKIAILKQLITDKNEQIHTSSYPNFPDICSPILYTNTARPCNIWRIVGDGNCFFRSLSFIITKSENNHHILRRLIVQSLQECDLPSTSKSVQDYMQTSHMSDDSVWATEVEIMTAAKVLQTDIYTYAVSGSEWKWLRFPACGSLSERIDTNKRAIYIQNTNRSHFDVVYGLNNTDLCLVAQNLESAQPKTTRDRVQEELNRQNLWQQNKDEQKQKVNITKLPPSSSCSNSTKRMQKLRATNSAYREQERKKDITYQRTRRQNKMYCQEQIQKNVKRMKAKRTDCVNTQNERTRNTKRMKDIRQQPDYSQNEKVQNRKRMKDTRQNEEYSQKEKKQNIKRMKDTRQNEEYSQNERKKNIKRVKDKRQNEEYSQNERKKNIKRVKDKRQNEEYSQNERKKNIKRVKDKRQKLEYSQIEQIQNIKRMNTIRKNDTYSVPEKQKNQERMAQARTDPQFAANEIKSKYNKRTSCNTSSIQQLQESFFNSISVGPEYVCCCCEQLWYKESVTSFVQKTAKSTFSIALHNPSINNKLWICSTCKEYINSDKIPPLSLNNNMKFVTIPKELQLHSLEEKLVALRIPFMQIRELPRGQQLNLKGNVVNVAADVSSTCRLLPRRLNESMTIPVKFKRKLSYKHSVQSENVRPNKVIDAAKWLVANSQLYKDERVSIDQNWNETIQQMDDDWHEFIEPPEKQSDKNENADLPVGATPSIQNNNEDNPDSDDDWTEAQNDDMQLTGTLDTMLTPEFQEQSQLAYCVAPGEGNRPMGLFQDSLSEILAFPTLFGGQLRSDNKVKVHYSTICKWELRNKDRRFAKSVQNIFYKTKKLQINQIQQKVTLSMRKKKTQGKKLTAQHFKTNESIKQILTLDEGFRVFRTLRGSPPYWERSKKELFAMIRQLGIPTWFLSFSAAETRWLHLLKILGRTIKNKHFTDEELLNMNWNEKSDLIQSDPVTCARHFDYMFRRFLNNFLYSSYHPIGEIIDHFYRVEFQQRGSPHIHMLVWVKDAPLYGNAAPTEVASFVDQYVTCNIPDTVNQTVNLQSHSHAKTCRKKRQGVCRFGFPIPPMPRTMILTPLEVKGNDKTTELYKCIKAYLDDLKLAEDITDTFEDMLTKLGSTERDYILAIRSSITSDKIFFKRSPSEVRINGYNKVLLETWRANMDIQYVLDPYACAMYIVSYISKGQRGMSNLMQRATSEAREGNMDIKQQVRHIGNKFLNHVEMSAQEAVYLVLQMSLRKASRQFVFINTSPLEDRTILIKPLEYIQQLPDYSTDIECMGLIRKYAARPKALQHYCLADFAAWFDITSDNKSNESTNNDYELDENDDDPSIKLNKDSIAQDYESHDNADGHDMQDTGEVKCYTVGALNFRKRNKAKIIRYVRFNKENDAEKYYREQLMLFFPWRSENNIIESCDTYQERYLQVESEIKDKEAEYNHSGDIIDQAIDDIENEDPEMYDEIAPNTEHMEKAHRDEKDKQQVKIPSNESPELYDIGQDIGIAVNSANIEELQKPRLPDSEYRTLVRSLNKKQKDFFYYVLHWCKTKQEPLYTFLTGGAGVGKSQVLKALYNALLKYYSSQPGSDPDDTHILLMAPTGKAAYGIEGSTIHSALLIPASQGFHYKALTSDKLNSLRVKFRNLKIIFIDEISMVGNGMFTYIDKRLQQIMGSKKIFGGVSIIAVGDLFQLKPVFDGWIFNNLTHDYGPLASNLWRDHFMAFELTEIMRQKDDQSFAQLLNRLRENRQTDDDLKLLNTRQFTVDNVPSNVTHVYQTNLRVNAHNDEVFSKLDTLKLTIRSQDIVVGDVPNTVKQKILTCIPNNPQKTMGLFTELSLGIDQRVDLCLNVSVEDGMINGATGIIKYIENVHDQNIHTIWVQFDDITVGKACRHSKRELYHSKLASTWTPISRSSRQFRIGRNKNAEVMRKQFPLRPATAKTVHRCQGDTMKEIVVDMSGARSQCHIHYVALSRVTSINGLYILELNPEKINVDRNVVKEVENLRSIRSLKICSHAFESTDSTTIIHQNVRSLKRHISDIIHDSTITSADILLFTECHISEAIPNDELFIEGFTLFKNIPSHAPVSNSPYGTVIYTKNNITTLTEHTLNTNNIEISLTTKDTCAGTVQIALIYRSNKVPMQQFHDELSNFLSHIDHTQQTLIIGDFNVDVLQNTPEKKSLLSLFTRTFKYQQIILTPTTDYNSCLDHIYTNIPTSKTIGSGVLESYYSDHKATWISLQNCHENTTS